MAVVKRNKLSEGSDKRAEFRYYQMETPDHPIGIDSDPDVARTAIRTRVLTKKGNSYYNSSFPNGKIVGKDNVASFLAENPDVKQSIRSQVLEAMVAKELKTEYQPEEVEESE